MRFPLSCSAITGLLCLVAITQCTDLKNAAGVYNSSRTPCDLPWDIYNYCNGPHVNSRHYSLPRDGSARLIYMNLMMRHHKRTPDNLYPSENILNSREGWDCSNFLPFSFGELPGGGTRAAHIHHQTIIPKDHPFLRQIWNGSCDQGQLTAGGFEDAIQHGKDLRSVYIDKLRFLTNVNEKDIYMRSSEADRTWAVSGALLFGLDPSSAGRPFTVHSEPSNIDTLVPGYSCPTAGRIRNQFQSVPAWTNHLDENADLKARLDDTLGTGGLSAWSVWYDHFFDTFTSRTCNGHPLPCNSTGHCVSEEDADRVHAIGDFEYNYIWKAAVNATEYNSLTFGGMFRELSQNFVALNAGKEPYKARFYVGHDGSMIRLASGLGIKGPLRWPELGSEALFEVWRTQSRDLFVRVLFRGTPANGYEWMPLSSFIELLQRNVPGNLFEQCNS